MNDKQILKLLVNNQEIANHCIFATSYTEKLFGLMLKKKENFPIGYAMLFNDCSSIHMFFMLFPIDVVFLNKEFKVLKIVRNLKINHVAFGPKGAVYTLELPIHGAKDLKVNDNVLLQKNTPTL